MDFTLQPADLICVRGHDLISKAIEHLEHGEFSHTAMYLGDGNRIVEAIKYGVEVNDLSKYTDYAVFRHPNLAAADAKKIMEYALSRVGDHYNFEHIFTLLLELTTKLNLYLAKNNATVCSELDDLAYFMDGIDLDKAKSVGDVDPEDITKSTELVKVFDTRSAKV